MNSENSSPTSPLIYLDTVLPRPLQWLWRPRLPLGRLSILVGHPDRGKSVVGITCSAHVSRGRLWPDGTPCPQGKVLLLESEDSMEETILPRLHAANADCSQIVSWRERHLSGLADCLRTVAPKLVVISPLNTYLPKMNTSIDQEVRRWLQHLADLAATHATALLGIMHPPKRQQNLPLHAIVGSVAFGAVARSVLVVERHTDGLYLMESLKQNLSRAAPPIGYRLQSWPTDPEVVQLVWQAVPSSLSLIDTEERGALTEACEYLRMVLDHGPIPTNKLMVEATKNGITLRTLQRARKLLNIEAEKVYDGVKSHWELWLPHSSRVKTANPP